jgi:hypothetical protein
MRGLIVALALIIASPAAAQERPRVVVTVQSLFGEGTLLMDAHVPVVVTLESRVARRLSGEVDLVLEAYDGEVAHHHARVDLPARATRQVVMTVFTDSSASHLRASFETEERSWGTATRSYDYSPGGRSMIVLGDPPRLRGALLDLDVNEMLEAGPRQIRVPIGSVSFDPASGDPLVPDDAVGWSSVKVILASAPLLARLEESERRALETWVETGGRLVVFPRTENDFADPWMRELIGPIAAERMMMPGEPGTLEANAGERFAMTCSGEQRTETFGCSATVGFGRVIVVSYDATSAAAIETGVPRELARAIYAAPDNLLPMLSWGRDRDDTSTDYYGYLSGFPQLRAALDPNEGFRPALVLVALVLLLYVVVVGPINFGWVQRKNRPVLALITTPAAALVCLLVLLMVGYIGKGIEMRYRRFELIDIVEGTTQAPARRYTGLFSTRPGSFDLPGVTSGAAHRIQSRSADQGPTYIHEGARVRMSDFRSGLWETVFLREDRIVPLGGHIRFERDDRRLSTLINESSLSLENAFVLDSSGSIYVVGAVRPRGRAIIPRTPQGTVALQYYDMNTTADTIAQYVGLGEDDRPYLRGMLGLSSQRLVSGQLPTLYARVRVRSTAIASTFAPETDYQWVRVVPTMRGGAIVPAPQIVDPTMVGYPTGPIGYDAGGVTGSGPPAVIDDPFLDAGVSADQAREILEALDQPPVGVTP